VGVVGDVSRAMASKVATFCAALMQLLLQALPNHSVDRAVKPHIIGCMADIALAVGGYFERYLKWVMQFLVQASATQFTEMDEDNIEYLNTLRESILEAYTGVLTGLGGESKAGLLLPFVDNIITFLDVVSKDTERDTAVTKSAVGVLGDLASQLGPQIAPVLHRTQEMVNRLMNAAVASTDDGVRKAAEWARKNLGALPSAPTS